MMNRGYFITAEIKVKDASQVDLARTELKKLQEKTLTEPGCDFFSVQQDTRDPTRFLMWERFDDEAAFKRHFEYPHAREYMEKQLTEVVQYFQTDLL